MVPGLASIWKITTMNYCKLYKSSFLLMDSDCVRKEVFLQIVLPVVVHHFGSTGIFVIIYTKLIFCYCSHSLRVLKSEDVPYFAVTTLRIFNWIWVLLGVQFGASCQQIKAEKNLQSSISEDARPFCHRISRETSKIQRKTVEDVLQTDTRVNITIRIYTWRWRRTLVSSHMNVYVRYEVYTVS